MELKNYLVELLSNIIHDKLEVLSSIKDNINKCEEYRQIENLLSDTKNIVDIDDQKLNEILSSIYDSDTVSEIISNIDMIKIVVKGMNDGLDLSLDDSQDSLIKSIYAAIDSYCNGVLSDDNEKKVALEDFISKCNSLSGEISTGVVRSIDVLDEIFSENNVSLDDVIKVKFEILRNNSKNYNINLDTHVKEEVDLRLALKEINVDFDSFNDVQKEIFIKYGNIDNINQIISYMKSISLSVDLNLLFVLLIFSNVSNLGNVVNLCSNHVLNFKEISKIPGVFVSSDMNDYILGIVSEYNDESISFLRYVGCYYQIFTQNISILESNGFLISDVFNNNPLSLIVPDMSKNISILSGLNLDVPTFSIVVINPFLATSISYFDECGLKEYLNDNPVRLTTSYYRLKNISSNIIDARKNKKVIFRSLSDKKNYWLTKDITKNISEVI